MENCQTATAESFGLRQTIQCEQPAGQAEILSALFAASSLAMIAIDQTGNIVALSRLAETLLGYITQNVKGQPGAMLLPALNKMAPNRIERGHLTIVICADGSMLRRRLMTTRVALSDEDCWIIILKPVSPPAEADNEKNIRNATK